MSATTLASLPERLHASGAADQHWYKDAVIYQVHVRAFRDGNGDWIGDFRGLTERLDYLADLGVTALWLLPFYPSPLRDDGYDTADYTAVHPAYGTLADAQAFIQAAHQRGLRVITELVCNHTSDQHAWFQRARRARPGSPERDFYVWSDTNTRYSEARIIFKDFETSNWTWDAVAEAFYWHRFYSHQPDLNFDNPKVREAVFAAMDFWLDLGVDGLRLDAIPYLFERDGTNCENLPETHEFLRELRRHVDERYPGRMLLAEANQWPEDAVAYFGRGDQCHMAFHFPLMPRMFMALQMEDRFPIVDILAQTPAIPESAQWAMFLRNHDELTLEMVTDEERDYMYRAYAVDAQARINLGIRRRLAPLLGNNRRRIELMNALLFALPGTPVIYYGDEIGMGDNIYLGDRNGVRTPMQWSPSMNAGFSEANRQKLYLPPIVDPEYHFESVNVETQQGNPQSFLWWMKRLVALRKRYRAFGRGDLTMLQPDNWKVLAFMRHLGDEQLLVVANLSRFAQCVQLDLHEHQGKIPVEVFGRVRFPLVGDAPYTLALGPHAFYWFSLERPGAAPRGAPPAHELPTVAAPGSSWAEWFRGSGRGTIGDALLSFMRTRRWFAGKACAERGLGLVDAVPLSPSETRLALVDVDYHDAAAECYVLPLAFSAEAEGAGAIARVGAKGFAHEALDGELGRALLGAIAGERTFPGEKGQVRGSASPFLDELLPGRDVATLAPTVMGAEQSNTSIAYSGKLMLKFFRKVEEGVNPDLEVTRFLNERAFAHAPRVAGALEYVQEGREPRTLGLLQEYVQNGGDAWSHALDAVGQYFERVLAAPAGEGPGAPSGPLLELAASQPSEALRDLLGPHLETARLIGRRTAELHAVLASGDGPAFAPEPFTTLYQRSFYQSMRNTAGQVLRQLRQALRGALPDDVRPIMQQVLDEEEMIMERLRRIVELKVESVRIRCHGDYHLGQLLHTGRDVMILDFEGEPGRPLGERRIKRTALRDVAGMIRSFDYAALTALRRRVVRPQDADLLRPWALAWSRWTSAAFLAAYVTTAEAAAGPRFLPATRRERDVLLETNLLVKALYEVGYELGSRPEWVRAPLDGILELLALPAAAPSSGGAR